MSKGYNLYVPLDQRAPLTLMPKDIVSMYDEGWEVEVIVKVVYKSGVFVRIQKAREYVYRCIYDARKGIAQ